MRVTYKGPDTNDVEIALEGYQHLSVEYNTSPASVKQQYRLE